MALAHRFDRIPPILERFLDRLIPITPPQQVALPLPTYESKKDEFDQLCCSAIATGRAELAEDALDLLEILGGPRWEHSGEFAQFIPQLHVIAHRELRTAEDWGIDSWSDQVSRA